MADYLSRATYPTDKQSDNTNSEEIHNVNAQFNVFNFTSIHELIEKQNKDPYCQNIKSKLNSNFVFSPKSPQFFIKDNLLLCKNNNMSGRHKLNTKLVVPQSLVPQILHLCHDIDAVAHPGLSRTMRRIQKNYFWRGQFRQVKNYIASCHECIQRRGYVKHIKAPIQRIPTADFPFQKCAFDAVGPLVTSNHGNKWIIVISDYFTRYAEAYPVKNIQSSTVAHVLMDFISRHGLMQVLYSDRGSNFISEAMNEIYKKLGIQKLTTLAYSPQSNGLVERLNKTLIDSLSHLVSVTQEDWCEHVPLALMAYRNAFHRSIKETPAFLNHGRDIVMPYDLIFSEKERSYSDTPSYAHQLVNRLQTSFAIVKENLEKAADDIEKLNNSKPKCKEILVGDLVYLHTPKIKIHTSKKFAKLNEGPFRVENGNNAAVSNEEDILKLYPCYTLPYKDWMDDHQNVLSNTVQGDQLSTQNVLLSANSPDNFEREDTNTPICNLTQNQPHDHTSVMQPLTNLPLSPVIDEDITPVIIKNPTVSKQVPITRTYGLRPRNALGFVKYN
ncbi:Retrovirus-related Pol polyprotein from transposon 412 [Araneus ventricosus]|uniref:RNA-directed DNA polymerase n=1 Tax=Araneus ventricosus TaxID=182803 RepID=A0A4Y2V013_ARAVE|nr:Retrovirus-related Pol polyprotein from transposon 412 [Araneus ventricosus]